MNNHISTKLDICIYDKILIVGCGNSRFSQDLHNAGYKNITSIDNSEVVIMQQKERFPNLQWKVADMRNLSTFETDIFDTIINKGLIDALCCNINTKKDIRNAMNEFDRVLKQNGKYIIVSLYKPEVLIKDIFDCKKWRIHSSEYISNPRTNI